MIGLLVLLAVGSLPIVIWVLIQLADYVDRKRR
jgi:hypothetical protein